MMISLMKNMTRQMILNAFLLVIWVSKVSGYCAGLGANPGFRGPPIVEQVSMTSVQVSWSGLVTRSECADQYIVKSWLARNPNDYQMSDLLPTTQLSFIVTDLVPNQDYVFQAIAREDKGILGKEWNRSDKTYFRTTSYNPTVTPDSDGGDSSNRGNKYQSGGSTSVYSPQYKLGGGTDIGVFTLAGIVIGSLLAVLIVVGGVWNIIKLNRDKRHKSGESESGDSSDSDSLDLDLENTDIQSRIDAHSRPPSRARSYRSRRRSPMSVRTGRTWSPSPPESLPDDSDRC